MKTSTKYAYIFVATFLVGVALAMPALESRNYGNAAVLAFGTGVLLVFGSFYAAHRSLEAHHAGH